MPETNKVETNQAMQFDAIQIGLEIGRAHV